MNRMKDAIQKLVNKQNLTLNETRQAMDMVLDNGATPAQISAFLVGLRMKGETIEEITGCAQTMKEKACHIKPKVATYMDFVGTGGDGVNTFNISTTAAFITAAAGMPVAKHGNRAISSKSGSVDVLEALGINVMITPRQVEACVEELGIGFMAAKTFHRFMKTAAQVRAELSIRTIFNILGPISNPSDAKIQLIGVFSAALTEPLAQAMANMGVENGMAVCCEGIDELTTTGINTIAHIRNGKVSCYTLTPEEAGFNRAPLETIRGGSPQLNADLTRRILRGEERGPKRDTCLFNAGAALYAGGRAASLAEGVAQAAESIDSGAAFQKLEDAASYTQSLGVC